LLVELLLNWNIIIQVMLERPVVSLQSEWILRKALYKIMEELILLIMTGNVVDTIFQITLSDSTLIILTKQTPNTDS